MKNLNCFVSKFSLIPSRFIFRGRPAEGPSPASEAPKEAKEMFKEWSLKIQDLNTQQDEITKKEMARLEQRQRPFLSQDEEIQRALLDRELRSIGEQLNRDYNLGIDFSKIDFFKLSYEKNGFHLIAANHGDNIEERFSIHVAIRADGTYDKRTSGVEGRKDTYYDSRTGVTRSYDWDNMSDSRRQIKDGQYNEPSFE